MKNTTLCYIQKDGMYLMLHRTKKENDANKDKWVGIGGKIENNENPLECVIREAEEETGLKLESPLYRGLVRFRSDTWEDENMYLFTCSTFSGTVSECDEGDLEWVPVNKVLSLPIWEGDRIFLERISGDSSVFNLTLEYHGEKLTSYSFDD